MAEFTKIDFSTSIIVEGNRVQEVMLRFNEMITESTLTNHKGDIIDGECIDSKISNVITFDDESEDEVYHSPHTICNTYERTCDIHSLRLDDKVDIDGNTFKVLLIGQNYFLHSNKWGQIGHDQNFNELSLLQSYLDNSCEGYTVYKKI